MSSRCYNSGPISHKSWDEAFKSFSAADMLIREVIGMTPVNPLTTWALPRKSPWICHMIKDLILMLTCGAVFFQKDWEVSKGARVEFKFARMLGMKVYFEI